MVIIVTILELVLTSCYDQISTKNSISHYDYAGNGTGNHYLLENDTCAYQKSNLLNNQSRATESTNSQFPADKYIPNGYYDESHLQSLNRYENIDPTQLLLDYKNDRREDYCTQTNSAYCDNVYSYDQGMDQKLCHDIDSKNVVYATLYPIHNNSLLPSDNIIPVCSKDDNEFPALHGGFEDFDKVLENNWPQFLYPSGEDFYDLFDPIREAVPSDISGLNEITSIALKPNFETEKTSFKTPITDASTPEVYDRGNSCNLVQPAVPAIEQNSFGSTLKRKNDVVIDTEYTPDELILYPVMTNEKLNYKKVKTFKDANQDDDTRRVKNDNINLDTEENDEPTKYERVERKIKHQLIRILVNTICKILSNLCNFKSLSIDVYNYFKDVNTLNEITEHLVNLQTEVRQILRDPQVPQKRPKNYVHRLRKSSLTSSDSKVRLNRLLMREAETISIDKLLLELILCLRDETAGEINSSLLFIFYYYPVSLADSRNYRLFLFKIIILVRFAFRRTLEEPNIKLSPLLEKNLLFYFCNFYKIRQSTKYLKRARAWSSAFDLDLKDKITSLNLFLFSIYKDITNDFKTFIPIYSTKRKYIFNDDLVIYERIKKYISHIRTILFHTYELVFEELCYNIQEYSMSIFHVETY